MLRGSSHLWSILGIIAVLIGAYLVYYWSNRPKSVANNVGAKKICIYM